MMINNYKSSVSAYSLGYIIILTSLKCTVYCYLLIALCDAISKRENIREMKNGMQ